MMKWLLLGAMLYLFYRSLNPILSIFRFNQSVRKNKRKKSIHKKISKMDIVDAEFDEKLD